MSLTIIKSAPGINLGVQIAKESVAREETGHQPHSDPGESFASGSSLKKPLFSINFCYFFGISRN